MSNKPAPQEASAPPARPSPSPLQVVGAQLKQNAAIFASLLGVEENSTESLRFRASAYSLCQSHPELLECDPQSILFALAEAAELGLSLNPRHGEIYLIPRWNKDAGRKVVNVQTGYRGLMKIMDGGRVDSIHVDVVRKGDHWVERGGTDPAIVHERPLEGDIDETDAGILAAYAVVWMKNSRRPYTVVVRRNKIEEAAERSGDPRKKGWSNVWINNFEEMAKKTALRRIAKKIPGIDDAAIEVIQVEDARDAGEQISLSRASAMLGDSRPSAPKQEPAGLDAVLEATKARDALPEGGE